MNKVLIVGTGGREHAIAWKLAQSPHVSKVYVAPGNAGMESVATRVSIDPMDFAKLTAFVKSEGISLTIPGPEVLLDAGIVDYFLKERLAIFGPTKDASIIEGSKSFAKKLMEKYKIPTGTHVTFSDYPRAIEYIKNHAPPYVLKADGLAEGKGVIITDSLDEADQALKDMLQNARFGEAGKTVVIEEFLDGEEFSYMAFVKGEKVYPMAIARDHKRAYDGDTGPNTGGMGVYSPTPYVSETDIEIARTEILEKTAKAMVKEGRSFTGVLFAGLIATSTGPKVIEFNARFGDPETEIVLPLLEGDLYKVITDILADKTPALAWSQDQMIAVVLASNGYPGKYETGYPIRGLDELCPDTLVFHCATKRCDRIKANEAATQGTDATTQGANTTIHNDNPYLTNGGRVLLIARKAKTREAAREALYSEIDKIKCDNLFCRKDIGAARKQSLLYQGKTKDVYENPDGTYTLKLKDTATGKDGVFDPGENAVGLSIDGLGRESLRLSKYFFEKLSQAGIPNHYIDSDIQAATMTVQPAKPFGNGIEFICRVKADGSFLRRYGAYTSFGTNLGYLVEVTIKDDERKDPPITKDALLALEIMTEDEYKSCKALTKKITKLVADELAQKGLELYDIKYEFFKSGDGVILADEFSAGVMRVYKDGQPVQPMDLASLILGDK